MIIRMNLCKENKKINIGEIKTPGDVMTVGGERGDGSETLEDAAKIAFSLFDTYLLATRGDSVVPLEGRWCRRATGGKGLCCGVYPSDRVLLEAGAVSSLVSPSPPSSSEATP